MTENGGGTVDALVVFSASLAKTLVYNDVRLPPTYVGARRVRPSSKQVKSALLLQNNNQQQQQQQAVVFKVTDENGNERRMTRQEKKELRKQLNQAKKERKQQQQQQTTCDSSEASGAKRKARDDQESVLPVNRSILEEELSDLRGERIGVPPVALAMPMGLQLMGASNQRSCCCCFNDELSNQWAMEIRESMKEAEQVRQNEKLRAMAYRIVPEAWQRLRPTIQQNDNTTRPSCSSTEWITIRPVEALDADRAVVVQFLHQHTCVHVSCGAKFGCDMLLYDGPRQDRHAFAGMRILPPNEPPPTAYNIAGYVRGLNTAGKLALLAKVVGGRVAVVDLALEKILSAPTHKKRARKEARKEVGKHLAKNTQPN